MLIKVSRFSFKFRTNNYKNWYVRGEFMNFRPIETVFEISENFLKDSKYVKINDLQLLELSNKMKLSPVVIQF